MTEGAVRVERVVLHRIRLPFRTPFVTAHGIETDSVLAGGEPSREIVAAAEREHCDLIAMSTHGHHFVKDVLYGSVANEVRHITRVPVLLVRGAAELV